MKNLIKIVIFPIVSFIAGNFLPIIIGLLLIGAIKLGDINFPDATEGMNLLLVRGGFLIFLGIIFYAINKASPKKVKKSGTNWLKKSFSDDSIGLKTGTLDKIYFWSIPDEGSSGLSSLLWFVLLLSFFSFLNLLLEVFTSGFSTDSLFFSIPFAIFLVIGIGFCIVNLKPNKAI